MSDEPEYGLVMPFVVCASKGGPYDDDAFVAGYEMGQLDLRLEITSPHTHEQYVRSASMKQVDLIAMRHGYTVRAEAWEDGPDEWTHVTLTKGQGPLSGEGVST